MLTVYRPGAKVGWRLARCRSVWFPGSPINVLVRLQGFQRPEQLCLLPSSWVPTRFFHDPPAPIVSGGVGHVDVPHAMLTRDRTQIRAARTALTAASCRVRTGDVVHSGSRRLGTVPRHLHRVGKDLSNVRAHVCTQHHRQTVTKATGGCGVFVPRSYGRGLVQHRRWVAANKCSRLSCGGGVCACTLQGSCWR